ncbi:MAG: hypothetical protein H8Z69_01125 [Nanohaloarchaea archaeon]|nr:hypothetical protein [Candidatus Nanohaloarchaea archaeon]
MFDKIRDYVDDFTDDETLLEKEHDTAVEDLFTERTGETKYDSVEARFANKLYNDVESWRTGINDNEIEGYSERISDSAIDLKAGNVGSTASELEVDIGEVDELYDEAVDEAMDENMVGEAFYKVTAGLERAIRDSMHSNLQRVELKDGDETVAHTNVTSTPGVMKEFTDYVQEGDERPEGYTLGLGGAVIDELNDYQKVSEAVKKKAGNTLKQQMERGDPNIDAVSGTTEYEAEKLEELGWADIPDEYA